MVFCQSLLQLLVTRIRIMNQAIQRADQGFAYYRRHAKRIYTGRKVEYLVRSNTKGSRNGKYIAAMII